MQPGRIKHYPSQVHERPSKESDRKADTPTDDSLESGQENAETETSQNPPE